MFLGILNWVWNLFCLDKNTCYFVGTPKVFGTKGMFGLADFALNNFHPISEIEHVEVVELIFVGILLLGMSCQPHKTTC